jgi:transporter family protein
METWLIYAILAAVFAALTTILAKIGITKVDSHVATTIRTVVVVIFAWSVVFLLGAQDGMFSTDTRTWVFLILSGLATGASWLCFFYALKLGTVNKVLPLKKSSTILTMLLAFLVLGEPFTAFSAVGLILIGFGTFLMTEFKKSTADSHSKSWLIFGLLAAVFASLTAILGAIGIAEINANLGNAIRTVAVLPMCFVLLFATRKQRKESNLTPKNWTFLILSGLATGASWLFFYRALQLGNATHVVPIDKLSIVLTMAFARVFLGERFTRRSLAGLAILTAGTILAIF